MKKEDLKEYEYYHYDYQDGLIFQCKFYEGNRKGSCFEIRNNLSFLKNERWGFHDGALRKATEEEIQWLKACIEANKFIPKEEALKSIKPQFEVGKWYKNLQADFIAKFDYLEGENKFFHSDYLNKEKTFKTNKGWLFTASNTVECPLSEIQQYLPDGHEDKIKVNAIPEYVELLPNWDSANTGKIFCTKDPLIDKWRSYDNWQYLLEDNTHKNYFKSSTKEAYDAQNQTKVQSIEEILEICKKKYPIGSIVNCLSSGYGKTIKENLHITDTNIWAVTDHNSKYILLYRGVTNDYAEIIELPKSNIVTIDDFGVHIHKGIYVGSIDPYQQELEKVVLSNTMSIRIPITGNIYKSNDLEYQYPVINVRNKKKSKLIIINQ